MQKLSYCILVVLFGYSIIIIVSILYLQFNNLTTRSRSKVYLKSLRDLDLELVAIFAMSPPTTTTTTHETFLSRITLKSLHV